MYLPIKDRPFPVWLFKKILLELKAHSFDVWNYWLAIYQCIIIHSIPSSMGWIEHIQPLKSHTLKSHTKKY